MTDYRRFFLDMEFIEDGRTIELISVGCVSEGFEGSYEAHCLDTDLSRASGWVRENVLPHLPPYSDPTWKTKEQIRRDLLTLWFGREIFAYQDEFPGEKPLPGELELWGYYCDYDWVAVCQLFGRMVDLPPNMPKFMMDVKMLARLMGDPKLAKQQTQEHVAINDAEWVRQAYFTLTNLKEPG